MRAYKLVNVEYDGTLTSAFIYGSAKIVYEPGKWTPKRRYGPFVFDTLKHLSEYVTHSCPSQQVWVCETSEDVHELDVMVAGYEVEIASLQRVRALMDKVSRDGDENDEPVTQDPWEGTLIASSIKLTERIFLEEEA